MTPQQLSERFRKRAQIPFSVWDGKVRLCIAGYRTGKAAPPGRGTRSVSSAKGAPSVPPRRARPEMPRIEHRPRASDDIAEIWDFIAEDSLAQADAFVDRLDRKLQLLATQPLMGRARDELASGCAAFPSNATSSSTSR